MRNNDATTKEPKPPFSHNHLPEIFFTDTTIIDHITKSLSYNAPPPHAFTKVTDTAISDRVYDIQEKHVICQNKGVLLGKENSSD